MDSLDIRIKVPGNDSYLLDVENKAIYVGSTGEDIMPEDGKVVVLLYGRPAYVGWEHLVRFCQFHHDAHTSGLNHRSDVNEVPYGLLSHGIKQTSLFVFNEPLTVPAMSGFRVLAQYPNTGINEDGDTLDIVTGGISRVKGNMYGRVNVFDLWSNSTRSILRHRLVAMAWKPNDDYIAKPIVDHNDGDKSNCKANNLEWVSFIENSRRMAEQGLRKDAIDLSVMDYKTGKVVIFGSMTQACEYMGRSRINRVEDFCSKPKLINGRYEIKLLSDTSGWNFINDHTGKYRVTIGGDKKSYHRLKDLIADLELSTYENGGQGPIIRELMSKYPEAVVDFKSPCKPQRTTYQVKCTDSGKVTCLDSRRSIESFTGLPKSTIAKAIAMYPEHSYGGYLIRVASDEVWPEEYQKSVARNKRLLLTSVKSGTTLQMGSMREASSFLNVDRNTIKAAMAADRAIKQYLISNNA